MKEFLSKNKVKHTYVDINESLMNLIGFLKIRDSSPIFDSIKQEGRVGLPCTVIDGKKVIIGDLEMKDLQ